MTETSGSAKPAGTPRGEATSAAGDGQPQPSDGASWAEGLTPEARAVQAAKGWEDPSAAVMSYAHLEKLFGADRVGNTVAIPKGADDSDGWASLYTRLGRPESAEGYTVPEAPQGIEQNGDFIEAMLPVLHEAGLSQAQLEKVVGGYNGAVEGLLKADGEVLKATADKEDQALRLQWGARFDAKVAAAKKAARAVPHDVADIGRLLDALEGENFVGRADIFRLFNWLGETYFSEDGLEGDGGGSFGMTPDQAKQQIESLKLDATFTTALWEQNHPNHRNAKERWDNLHKAAYG